MRPLERRLDDQPGDAGLDGPVRQQVDVAERFTPTLRIGDAAIKIPVRRGMVDIASQSALALVMTRAFAVVWHAAPNPLCPA